MSLRLPGKIERRLALAILLTGVVPLAAAIWLVGSLFGQASAIWFNPEIGQQLDRGVDVYKDYVKAIKDDMRHQTDAIAADEILREAAKKGNLETVEAAIEHLFPHFPELVSLRIEDAEGRSLARRDRGKPVDESTERSLEVRRALVDEDGPVVIATFAVERKRLDELENMAGVVMRYHTLESSRGELYHGYLQAFGALLGATMLISVLLGILLARGVTRRINRLAAAIELVASGDLAVRVPVTGNDELGELARTFNKMLGEMAQSRARIEFLQRIGAWQEMAKRLAHEIKNPLTPIQLAVQECHRKYSGDDPRFRHLLDTTLEIVEEEVGTLRRLVGDFSNFARLPQAELKDESLRDFLRELSDQLAHLEEISSSETGEDPLQLHNVEVAWRVPDEPLIAAIDRQMLRRVLVNLVRNAVQAIRDDRKAKGAKSASAGESIGRVIVSAAREGDGTAIAVEDDGPGVPDEARLRIFDPYVTTKEDGTGLGLAIVKKIVVEHGGSIDVSASPIGGARFVIHFPGPRTLDASAARDARERAIETGVHLGGAPPV